MSALHRLKAYFGMVPAGELDDFGRDYRDYRDYDYDDYDDDLADRGYSERPVAHRVRHAALDGYDGAGRYARADGGYPAADVAGIHSTHRCGWTGSDPPPVRGSLAMDTAAPPVREPVGQSMTRSRPLAEEDSHPLGRIVTLHPRNYNEARPIGERYREGTPVIMNLTEMDDADAKRLVDFAAGLAFALRGSIDKVTSKVFLISPANVDVTAEDKRRIAEGGLVNQ